MSSECATIMQQASAGQHCHYCFENNKIKNPAIRIVAGKAVCQHHEPPLREVEDYSRTHSKPIPTLSLRRRKFVSLMPASPVDPARKERGVPDTQEEAMPAKKKIDEDQLVHDLDSGMAKQAIAEKHGISVASVYARQRKLVDEIKLDLPMTRSNGHAEQKKGISEDLGSLAALEEKLLAQLQAVRDVRAMLGKPSMKGDNREY